MQQVNRYSKLTALLAYAPAQLLLLAGPNMAVAQSESQDAERIVIPLSSPTEPAVLDIELFQGSVTVTGYEGTEIIIETDRPGFSEPQRAPNREGLRSIGNTSRGFTAEEQNNVVSIRAGGLLPTNIAVTAPIRTSVKVNTVNGFDMTIANVTGDHELSNVNGGITANDIGGTVVANATNGALNVSFSEVAPDRPMSFTTLNGFIDVSLPADTNADLSINTNRGEILTDFDVEVQPSQAEVERDDSGGRFRVKVNQDVRAKLGDGGPEYRFRTFNGDVVIRSR